MIDVIGKQTCSSTEIAIVGNQDGTDGRLQQAPFSGAAIVPGGRREGVTEAAGKLQRAGLIRYSRGHIIVLDRQQLEQQVC